MLKCSHWLVAEFCHNKDLWACLYGTGWPASEVARLEPRSKSSSENVLQPFFVYMDTGLARLAETSVDTRWDLGSGLAQTG